MLSDTLQKLISIYEESTKQARLVKARKAIARLCGPPDEHYSRRPITYTELAGAFGWYTSRSNPISDYIRGVRTPSVANLALLELTANDFIEIEWQGNRTTKEGPNRRQGTVKASGALVCYLIGIQEQLEAWERGWEVFEAWSMARGDKIVRSAKGVWVFDQEEELIGEVKHTLKRWQVHSGRCNDSFSTREEALHHLGKSLVFVIPLKAARKTA